MDEHGYQFSESYPHPVETKATQEGSLDFGHHVGNPSRATAGCNQDSRAYAPVLYPISPAVVHDNTPTWSPCWNAKSRRTSNPTPLTTPPQAHSTPLSTRPENRQLHHMFRNPTHCSQINYVSEMHPRSLSELKATKFQRFIANNSTMRQICEDTSQKQKPPIDTAKNDRLLSIEAFSAPHIQNSYKAMEIPFTQYSDHLALELMDAEVDLGYYSLIDDSTKKENGNQTGSDHNGTDDFHFSKCSTSKGEQSDFVDKILDFIDENNSNSCPPSDSATNIKEEQDLSSSSCMYVCDQALPKTQTRTPSSVIQSRDTINAVSPLQTPSQFIGSFGSENRSNNINFILEDPAPLYEQFIPFTWSCPVCQAALSTKRALREHVLTHKEYRPYQCVVCSKGFRQKSTLAVHIRIHTGERPYKCQHCERAFADCSTFRKHSRTHTGEKPYECSVCQKKFGQSGNMIRHEKMHFKSLENVTATSVQTNFDM
ncbi:hypothetical protein ACJMK2_006534 [Sinanodonta woodiana]|uniref:C2H2-type domain-containing protein n=1 Tax=Sinanodonta woodiana TaxID=1069815 RepID=A0ABD3VTF8_SINWO